MMKEGNKNSEACCKKRYATPAIEIIVIDTQISLEIQSNPPYPGTENTTGFNSGVINPNNPFMG
jgi:hypothetical protein